MPTYYDTLPIVRYGRDRATKVMHRDLHRNGSGYRGEAAEAILALIVHGGTIVAGGATWSCDRDLYDSPVFIRTTHPNA